MAAEQPTSGPLHLHQDGGKRAVRLVVWERCRRFASHPKGLGAGAHLDWWSNGDTDGEWVDRLDARVDSVRTSR